MVFEHGAKHHRVVMHLMADAFQSLRQSLKRQPRVGRNEVEIKMNLFHEPDSRWAQRC